MEIAAAARALGRALSQAVAEGGWRLEPAVYSRRERLPPRRDGRVLREASAHSQNYDAGAVDVHSSPQRPETGLLSRVSHRQPRDEYQRPGARVSGRCRVARADERAVS